MYMESRRRWWHPTPGLLPGKSYGWRSLVGCSPPGCEESDTTEWLHFHFSLSCIGEGNGNPLQCSCLENPRDGGAWWAAVSGVAQSRTWLKWLSSSSIWNLEGWYWWTYLQGSHGDTERTDLWAQWGKERAGRMREQDWNIDIATWKTESLWEFVMWPRELNRLSCDNLEGWDGVDGGREVPEGGDMYTPMADSCCCLAETNTIL